MDYQNYLKIELNLDDIKEIITQVIVYMNDPQNINDSDELYFAILSIFETIEIIKEILRKEL